MDVPTERLRTLERLSVVVYPKVPVRVEYTLTLSLARYSGLPHIYCV